MIMYRINILLVIAFLFGVYTKISAENYPHRSDVLWVTTPDHSNWLYKTNEKAKISVAVYHYGILQDTLTVNYSIAPDMMEADKSGSVKIKME